MLAASRALRIVFMGTPDFAVASLKALLDHNFNVVGVITAPDKPAGRGKKMRSSAVKAFAEDNNLNLLQPTNLKDDRFIEELSGLNANLQVVVAFRMLPKVVWQMPEYGTFNLHASLLPQYRGAAPIHWAIINGETKTGVTTFFIDEKIDTGELIASVETDIHEDETFGSLHNRLMILGSELVVNTVRSIETDSVITVPQPEVARLKTASKLNKDNCKIDWTASIDNIYNKIRGLNPFPAAWCYLNNHTKDDITVKLFAVKKEYKPHNEAPGTIEVSKTSLKVYCNGGCIEPLEIQLPGKRKMTVKALLNGFDFSEKSKLF